MFVGLT